MNKKLKKEKINLEIFEENGKVGIRGKGKDEGKIFVEPIYDYDKALLGSYYVDPEYWGNYYLYRFRDGFAIFKKGKNLESFVCSFFCYDKFYHIWCYYYAGCFE